MGGVRLVVANSNKKPFELELVAGMAQRTFSGMRGVPSVVFPNAL